MDTRINPRVLLGAELGARPSWHLLLLTLWMMLPRRAGGWEEAAMRQQKEETERKVEQ